MLDQGWRVDSVDNGGTLTFLNKGIIGFITSMNGQWQRKKS